MSLFISFEGGEGSGKTTQTELLHRRLLQVGRSPMVVREPGTTPLGWYLRDWLKRQRRIADTISDVAELFLFAAARAEFVAKVLEPEIRLAHRVVIADRYADSTTAYQGYGRKIPLELVKTVNSLATQNITPDLTFFLDCSAEEGKKRIGSMQLMMFPIDQLGLERPPSREQEGTRFEEESLEFHRRVRIGYLEIAEQESDRWCVIDGTQDADSISEQIWGVVKERLNQAGARADDASGMKMPLWAGGPESESDQEAD